MNWKFNEKKESNQKFIDRLIKQGYTNLGWANSSSKFSSDTTKKESLDISTFNFRNTNMVYICHTNKELLHIDSSN